MVNFHMKEQQTNKNKFIIVNWNNPQDYYRSRAEIVELEEITKDDEFIKLEETTALAVRLVVKQEGWVNGSCFNNWNTNTVSFSTSVKSQLSVTRRYYTSY